MKRSTALLISLLGVMACEKKPKVSFDTAEESRKTARDNSSVLARQFRAEAKFEDYDIMLRGDSTITVECPQGDGWASIDMINKVNKDVIKLKCSTVSLGMGCLLDSDFKQRATYANQEGSCNKDLPFPLPKILN